MSHSILLLVLCVACADARGAEHQAVKGSPMTKIITLLERLQKEIQKEGQEEAAAYDKLACFCKEQADEKLYAITKSKETIKMLEAQIEDLGNQIKEHDAAVEKDEKEKKSKEEEGEKAKEKRDEARKTYEEEEEGLSKALAAIKEAIEALKESKGKMTDAKLSMVAHTAMQVLVASSTTTTSTTTTTTTTSTTTTTTTTKAASQKANVTKPVVVNAAIKALKSEEEKTKELVDAQKQIAELKAQLAKAQEKTYNKTESAASSAVKKVLALLSGAVGEPGKPAKYEYGSNSIIETLQTLFKQFRDNKYELDNSETKEKQEYEMEKGARDMQIKFLADLIAKNTKLSAEKSEKKAGLETDRDDEQGLQEKDQEFMDELTKLGEEKAEGWDARSEKRSAELTAISKAIEALNSGAVQNYGSTTVLIEKGNPGQAPQSAPVIATVDEEADQIEDAGFLQLRSRVKRHFGKKHGAKKAVIEFLQTQAGKLKSTSLALVVAQLGFSADNFAKIRELIKDLVQKIKDQMEAEKDKMKFCDEMLGKSTDMRDEMMAKAEEEQNNIDGAEAKMVKLKDDIAEAELQVAELYKALNEATELRDEEKANNAKTLAENEEGLAAVKKAIEVLNEFYGGFLQVQSKAPGGRDGKSVADLAPEAETGEYEGKTDAGKGIIGLLETVEGDFDRSITDTKDAEDKSKTEFEDEEKRINEDIDALKGESKDKKDELDTTESDLVEHKEALKDAKDNLASAKDELEKLRPQCVDLGLTFKARQARSEEEIKALEEALKILEEYK